MDFQILEFIRRESRKDVIDEIRSALLVVAEDYLDGRKRSFKRKQKWGIWKHAHSDLPHVWKEGEDVVDLRRFKDP